MAVDAVDEGEVGGVGGGGGVFAGRWEEEFVADGGGEGDYFDAVGEAEDFFGDCAGCYAAWEGAALACPDLLQYDRWCSQIVSLALLRPPPLLALTPYFSR